MLISYCVFGQSPSKNTKVVSISTTNIYIRIYSLTFHCRAVDKSLARPTSRCIFSDGENISFDASLIIFVNCTNISPIMIINRINENQNLLSL